MFAEIKSSKCLLKLRMEWIFFNKVDKMEKLVKTKLLEFNNIPSKIQIEWY